jgi:thiol:disulfide interchange protein
VPEPTDAPEVRPSNDYPKSWLEGATGYEDATRYAREAGAMVTLYVYTDWCPYCRRLEEDLLSDSTVQQCLDASVKARVNPERSPTNQAVAQRFGVTGYPSLYFVNPSTGVGTKIPTYLPAGGGRARLLTPREFVTICWGMLG